MGNTSIDISSVAKILKLNVKRLGPALAPTCSVFFCYVRITLFKHMAKVAALHAPNPLRASSLSTAYGHQPGCVPVIRGFYLLVDVLPRQACYQPSLTVAIQQAL